MCEEEEEGDPRALQFLLRHMKSFVINKSLVYALYMDVCAFKHTHTHTHTHIYIHIQESTHKKMQ